MKTNNLENDDKNLEKSTYTYLCVTLHSCTEEFFKLTVVFESCVYCTCKLTTCTSTVAITMNSNLAS